MDPKAFLTAYGRSVMAIPRIMNDPDLDEALRGHYAEELLMLLAERASVLAEHLSSEFLSHVGAIDLVLLSFQDAVAELLGVRVGDLLTPESASLTGEFSDAMDEGELWNQRMAVAA